MPSATPFVVRNVAVLGAGVMGAQIAAQLANADVQPILFELPAREGDPSANVRKAIEGLKKLDPSPISSGARADFIRAANYDQHLELLRECDVVIEAISERMDWKKALYEKVAPHLAEHAIFASNTSGLSINELSRAMPESLRHRFCGVHFFNPPRYMHLVELIPCQATEPAILDRLETFLVTNLGKGVIRAKDTPNFIANRVGVFSMLATMHHCKEFGLGFDLVDALTGPLIGRPKSATFRTADVVGLDTLDHVVKTMADTLPNDPWYRFYASPDWLKGLIETGALGQKTKRGIYQKVGKEIQVLDLQQKNYRPSAGEADDKVKEILKNRNVAERFAALRSNADPQAQFLWACYRDVFHYCAVHLAEIADNARDVDLAIRWGFGWNQGPFEIWQAAGWQTVAGWIAEDIAAGKTMVKAALPGWVTESGRAGVHAPQGSFAPATKNYAARSNLPVYKRQPFPDGLLGESRSYGQTVFETDAVRLWHMGDEVAVLSFKSKMHTIGDDVLEGTQRAIEEAERGFRGLVIWQTEPPFSVGANLQRAQDRMKSNEKPSALGSMLKKFKKEAQSVVLKAARQLNVADALMAGKLAQVEEVVVAFQQTTQALKYAMVPTVAAVDGMAFGGGCEFIMHSARAVATLESYIGLVEVGVGLLPAAGGCKEFALRAARETRGGNHLALIQSAFQTIAMAQVGKSAEQAKELGYLRPCDRIVMNRFELLHVAKAEAIALAEAGYRPPLKAADIPVVGRTGIGHLQMILANMKEGSFISDHDHFIASRVARVLCGGDVEPGSLVDEDWLLELERQTFMELIATEKTQARIEHMLKTGKPLRN
ncbi:MAG: 3-hydroxyacyl-CoA dehydrogenase/enoyl-CoA hydratase family protein [Betaproteobacteria bacterium]|nr:3-hydroxyacyl-CoA dehydrogenase/enoyl-CoA hydratase family protein [Betaproteobacteria bacterium]